MINFAALDHIFGESILLGILLCIVREKKHNLTLKALYKICLSYILKGKFPSCVFTSIDITLDLKILVSIPICPYSVHKRDTF